jgi:molybdate transport system ATP-binding protein
MSRPSAERDRRAHELLERLDISEISGQLPRELSGGQTQRVALARALAPRPDLLLLDEPFAALDGPARNRLRADLRALLAPTGTSAVLVTHDRTEALALGDEIAVLAGGRVRQVGPVVDVMSRPADLEVAQSLGVETVLSATVESAERGLLTLRIGSRSLRAVDVDASRPGARVFACIRAEDVLLERQLSPAASARNQVPARVVAVNRDGPLERVALDCGFPLVALITRHAREEMELVEGSAVIAAIKAISVHLVPRT